MSLSLLHKHTDKDIDIILLTEFSAGSQNTNSFNGYILDQSPVKNAKDKGQRVI